MESKFKKIAGIVIVSYVVVGLILVGFDMTLSSIKSRGVMEKLMKPYSWISLIFPSYPGISNSESVVSTTGTDCVGTWSACTPVCEAATARTFTTTTPQSGTGAACPAAVDCVAGSGGCVDWSTMMGVPYIVAVNFIKEKNPTWVVEGIPVGTLVNQSIVPDRVRVWYDIEGNVVNINQDKSFIFPS